MPGRYIYNLQDRDLPPTVGNKADKLRFLNKKGYRTPPTFVCTWDAYSRYIKDDLKIIDVLAAELSQAVDASRSYAVRSSANIEDSLDFSFAGQFKSVLDVRGVDDILRTIWSVWATAQSPGVEAYLKQHGIDPNALRMAVIIQAMVPSAVSGVAFSKNPITGLDEIVVEAVCGSGTALAQEGITPHRWINKWGEWVLMSGDEEVGFDVVQEVVKQTKSIAKAYGKPVDLEWVYNGESIYWVQLREITTIDINVYSNHISKEVFPGIIKPLVWSVNVPLVNGAWVKLFTELIGPNDIDPTSLARSIYYRAYFNMGTIGRIFERLGLPRETLELLMGIEVEGPDKPSFRPSPKTYSLFPRMLRVAVDKLRFRRKIDAFLPAANEQYKTFRSRRIDQLSECQLLDEIDQLYALTQEAAYYNIVTPLLMQIYYRILKNQLEQIGVDIESFDLTAGMEELKQYEPNVQLKELNQLYTQLDKDLQQRIRSSSYDEFRRLPGVGGLQKRVQRFIEQCGHLSDSGNDFSAIPWREEPNLILKMIVNYTTPQDGVRNKLRFEDLKIPLFRRLLLGPIYRRARQYRLYREAVSSLYTFGYGLFRDCFLALGDHCVAHGTIASRDDVFFLYLDEVRAIIHGDHHATRYQEKVKERKREISRAQGAIPPSIVYGDDGMPLATQTSNKLRGTPTSRGHYTGRVRVVQGIRDFDKLNDGDVLVIPYSDVGWTPLFTKAGAVVAESGGILSHSSIVAREYNIPAVVSVFGACQIADNTVVTVDGYRGEVIIHSCADA